MALFSPCLAPWKPLGKNHFEAPRTNQLRKLYPWSIPFHYAFFKYNKGSQWRWTHRQTNGFCYGFIMPSEKRDGTPSSKGNISQAAFVFFLIVLFFLGRPVIMTSSPTNITPSLVWNSILHGSKLEVTPKSCSGVGIYNLWFLCSNHLCSI